MWQKTDAHFHLRPMWIDFEEHKQSRQTDKKASKQEATERIMR